MVEEALVGADYLLRTLQSAGKSLRQKLDEMQVGITAAFWQFVEEDETWRLCLATPLADLQGPLRVYSTLRTVLSEMSAEERGDLELADISVISPHMRVVVDLQRQYGKIEHEDKRRIRRVDGPFIYRLNAS